MQHRILNMMLIEFKNLRTENNAEIILNEDKTSNDSINYELLKQMIFILFILKFIRPSMMHRHRDN